MYKKLVDNTYEREVFGRFPELKAFVKNVGDGDSFEVEPNLKLFVIETPGHKEDHLSYGLEDGNNDLKILFPGDAILGTPSVS